MSLILAVTFASCKKDAQDNTNTPSALSFKMQAVNKSVSLPVQASGLKSSDSTNAVIVWDTAFMLVSKIKFEAEMKSTITGHDSLKIEYNWRGPQIINMFDLSSTIGSITLPSGTYEEISLQVKSEKEDANGQPLFYLSGSYANETGVILPIVISVSDPIMFKTEHNGDTIVSGVATDFSSTIQVYLDQLLLDVDISALDNATLTNGILLISAEANTELYHLIMQNLRKDHHCQHEHEHHGNH